MVTSKLDIDRLFRQPDSVAVMVAASDLFGFLSRGLRLPSEVAALAFRERGDRVVVRPSGELASDGIHDVLLVRTSPHEVSLAGENLLAQDKYLCAYQARLRIAVVPERSELESFRDAVMGSNRSVRIPALVRQLEGAVADAMRELAAAHDVEDLVDGKLRDEAATAVRKAVQAPCFEAGLALAGTLSVEFHSDALRELRAKEAATVRRLEEHAAEQQLESALADARAKHLGHLETTLKKLQSLAAESPHAELPELLRTFGEAERGRLYAALFESQAITPATRWLVAACGPHLVFFSPDSLETPARKLTLEGPIGPLRSIQFAVTPDGQRRLFAGAARGVYELAIESSAPEVVYTAEAAGAVRGGINAVATLGDDVFASHSELGLLRWNRARPERASPCLPDQTRGAKAVRNVHAAGDYVVFSVDDHVIAFRPAHEGSALVYSGSTSVITTALRVDGELFAGNADGQVLHWPSAADAPRILHGGGGRAAESVALLSLGGVPRLLYTDTTLAVFARVLGDTFICRYEAGGQTLRRVDVAADLIVATTDARDRLVIWRPNRPALPVATINVHRLTGHTVQDVTLVPI